MEQEQGVWGEAPDRPGPPHDEVLRTRSPETMSRYERYKDTIRACQKRWLEIPENRKKKYEAEKKRIKRKKEKDRAIIAKFKELEAAGLIPSLEQQ
jgi:hypothetical protein